MLTYNPPGMVLPSPEDGGASPSASYENDVFVSYAHIDDEPVEEGQPGWVATLHRVLQVRLAQLLGKEPRIWRDPKLQGNDVFGDTLVARLPRVAVLVSVVSPRYVRSEWCQRELNEFLMATGGARVADKLRVFKVVKTPVPHEQTPQSLQPMLGYEFFTVDSQNGRERELQTGQRFATPEQERLYFMKLDDLAHDVADLLRVLEGDGIAVPGSATAKCVKGCVYLAETSSDLRGRRDTIRRELQASGYTVFPDQPLPLVGAECAAFVREQLSRCRLSVHMIGNTYGIVPEGSTESTVVLQHELAVERATSREFCRLTWMPPDLSTDDPRQRQFLERLQSDPRSDAGTDLLKTPIEDFKSMLHLRLNPPVPIDKGAALEPSAKIKRIYLICDQRDLEHTRPLEDFLFERKYEVTVPVFNGDEAQVRLDHEANLTECDAALVYYGAGNELWLRSQLRELLKIVGKGRTKPMLAKGVYVAPPVTPEKARFRTLDAIVIAGGDRPNIETLSSFLEKLA
jgi:hypothetical protein